MYQFSLFLTAVSLYILGEVKRMNLFQALTDAMDVILDSDESAGIWIKDNFSLYSLIGLKTTKDN